MKKLSVISLILLSVLIVVSCSDIKRTRGREYMPDMAYSRAYETYSSHENLTLNHINYTAIPVAGTIKRGEVFPFSIPRDKDGDSSNYIAARQVVNPIPALDSLQLKEAERMYLINCAICHGTALDGNGPLYNGGNGPYSAAPKNLVGDPVVSVMPEGQLFYTVTYGKGQMGPYSSQLTTSQRWKIVRYVKTRQLAAKSGGGKGESSGSDSTGMKSAGGQSGGSSSNGQSGASSSNGQSGASTTVKKASAAAADSTKSTR